MGNLARTVTLVLMLLPVLATVGERPLPGNAAQSSAKPQAPVASITAVLRSGLLQRAGVARLVAATPFAPLFTGDHVRTAAGERTAILLQDGSQVLLNENTDLGIAFPVMHLYHGEIFARIVHGNSYHVVVGTDAAVAAVRGTQFDLTAGIPGSRGDTVLTVVEGNVQLSNRYGAVLVAAGQQAAANPNTAPSQPIVVQLSGITLWTSHVVFSTSIALPPHYASPAAAAAAARVAASQIRRHPQDAQARFALADADADLGSAQAARVQYGRILVLLSPAKLSERARAEIGIASMDLALADSNGADTASRIAQQLDPSALQADLLRGDAALARGGLASALHWFETARLMHPGRPEPLQATGFALLLQRHDSAAILALQAALALHPSPWLAESALVDLSALATIHGYNDQALTYAVRAVRADPREAIGWIAAGVSLGQLGRYEEAAQTFTTASRIGLPFERVMALDDLGDAQYNLGHIKAEADAYRTAFALDPHDATAANGLGWADLAEGRFASAVSAMHRAAALAPHSADLQADYARALWANHQPVQAEAVCREALRNAPRNINVLLVLGFALDGQGKSAAARGAYQAAYALRPTSLTSADDAALAGSLALYAGRLQDARVDLLRAAQLRPANYRHWEMLALVLQRLKLFRPAIDAARRAVALNPEDTVSHSTLALSYLAIHDYADATAEFTIVLRQDPEEVGVRAGLAIIAESMGDLTGARKYDQAEISIQQLPGNLEHRADYLTADWIALGLVLDAMHDPRGAAAAYREALRYGPRDVHAMYLLAIDLRVLGQTKLAITILGSAIRVDPTYAAAFHLRAIDEQALGQFSQAESDYRRAISLAPRDGRTRLHLGVLLVTEAKYAAARDQLRPAAALLKGQSTEVLAWQELGVALDRLHAYADAADARRHIVALQPNSAVAHSELGLDLLLLGRLGQARDEFAEVARLNPNDPYAYFDLALVDDKQGHAGKAVSELQHQIAVNTGKTAYLLIDYRYLGYIHAEQLQWRQAVTAYSKVISLGGESDSDFFALGYAQAKAGDSQAALQSLHKAYALARAAHHGAQATAACKQITALGGTC